MNYLGETVISRDILTFGTVIVHCVFCSDAILMKRPFTDSSATIWKKNMRITYHLESLLGYHRINVPTKYGQSIYFIILIGKMFNIIIIPLLVPNILINIAFKLCCMIYSYYSLIEGNKSNSDTVS